MKLYSLIIFDKDKKIKYSNHNLDDVFVLYRYMVKNEIETVSLKIINTIKLDNFYKINESINNIHLSIYGYYIKEKYIIVITDKEYPQLTIYNLYNDIKNELTIHELNILWYKYQNPLNSDKIQLIKSELDQTKITLIESIEKLIERGEKLSDLVDKTNQLDIESLKFRNKAKNLNRCCIIL